MCPEGWTFYRLPGPAFAGRDGAAEAPYYTWVDQHDILGLGPNTPIGTGNFSDSLHALTYGRVVELRVPYPMGFFAKGVDGRIDDPKAGWKGRGLWVPSANRTPMHIEGSDAPSRARRVCRVRWSCASSSGPTRWRTSDIEQDSTLPQREPPGVPHRRLTRDRRSTARDSSAPSG
jgi:hypothetical protein